MTTAELAPSGNMKRIANCTVLSTYPSGRQTVNLIDYPADSELDAARFAAEAVAKRLYGNHGVASFVGEVIDRDPPLYRASIGIYNNGVTKGHSVDILIRRYGHPVTGKVI